MILTIVPNPSLDKTAIVPGFELGKTFRVSDTLGLAGGKAFNFARAVHTLGEQPLVVGPLGGHIGQLLIDLATAEGLACDAVRIEGETRTCLTIVDPDTRSITELYERGPGIGAGVWERLVATAARHLLQARWMAISGSCPPGTPETGLRQLVEQAQAAGVPALLDTYGPQLAHALAAGPRLVKINQHEAAEAVGCPVDTGYAAIEAAAEIQSRGAQAVIITLGKQGAAGIDQTGERFGWAAPEVAGMFPIGSGDALFGGVVAGLARGQTLAQALRLGVAVGAANTLQMGAGVFAPLEVDALLPRVQPLAV